jgi:MFS transporter, ACS family, D-galactonate transporter
MSVAVQVSPARGRFSWMGSRQLDTYPDTGARVTYLAITVLATITLYYELYVGASVSTLLLPALNMSFSFYVTALAFGNLIGAFGSLFAGLADRLGRANLVVFGLLFTGVYTLFFIPYASSKWPFIIETFTVGVVEGICLVATPALIRDFSPQVGRASAMGFWTSGPVLGSLIVSWVGTATIPAVVSNSFWGHEFRICGVVGLIVFAIAFVGLRELSPQLRDQLMVTMHDRALIEARAKGIDIHAALRHPFRQLVRPDIVFSALAVSVMLLIYYTSVAFGVIYLTTVFGITLKDANGLGNWNWSFNAIAVIGIGILSDKLRVRKPLMVIGGVAAAVMVLIYLEMAGHHESYYTLALVLALLSFCLGVAYTPWMASFTETVEDHNPALTATGLAIWGWIIRIVVSASFFVIPHVIPAVNPLVSYGPQAQAYLKAYPSQLAFAQSHPKVVAIAQKYGPLAIAAQTTLAPELAVLKAHPAVFLKLSTYSNPVAQNPKLVATAIKDAGGGAKGIAMLQQLQFNAATIKRIIAAQPQFAILQQYPTQLVALSKVPPAVGLFFAQHGAALTAAQAQQVSQWKRWYWVCFAGIVFFLFAVPLLRGRWRPAAARRDEQEHEEMVQRELAALQAA